MLAEVQGYSLNVGQAVFVLSMLNLAICFPVSLANVGTFRGLNRDRAWNAGNQRHGGHCLAATVQHVSQLVGIIILGLADGSDQTLFPLSTQLAVLAPEIQEMKTAFES